jgi:hypothetical protein
MGHRHLPLLLLLLLLVISSKGYPEALATDALSVPQMDPAAGKPAPSTITTRLPLVQVLMLTSTLRARIQERFPSFP